MAEKTNVDVEMIAEGDGIFRVLDSVNDKIGGIQRKIDAIVRSTDLSAKQFDKAVGKQVKELQNAMSRLATLEKSLTVGASDVRQVNQARQLANATKNATQFAGTLKNAENTSMALTARLNDIDKAMVKIATRGGLAPNRLVEDRRKLEEYSRALAALDRQYAKLVDKARQSGGNFSSSFSSIATAREQLFAGLKDPNRSDFTAEMQRLKDLQAALGLEIGKELAGRRAGLRVQKELAIAQAKELQTLAQITAARKQSETAMVAARARLTQATGREQKQLLDIISLEKARTAELVRQERLRTPRQPSAPEGPDLPTRGTLGTAFAGTARYGLAAAGIYGVVNASQQGIGFLLQFEDALANLQAIASATDAQMQSVAATILDVGSSSKLSVIELTEAATTLAQAGFSVADLNDTLGAVSTLAVGSGSSVADAVDLMTSAMGSFNLQTSEAARISDVLVAALNRSKLSVQQVALAVQYAGATARENNISLDELVATAGALSNAGIRSGSTIGTGLRQLLVDLKTPTDDLQEGLKRLGLTAADVDVKTKGLSQVIETLRNAGFGASQAYEGLEVRAAASYLTLSRNLDTMNDLLIAEQEQGQAILAQERAMNSLTAQWQRFKNIVAESTDEIDGSVFTQSLKAINDYIEGLERQGRENEKANQLFAKQVKQMYEAVEASRRLGDQYAEQGDYLSSLGEYLSVYRREFEYWVAGLDDIAESSNVSNSSLKDLETQLAETGDELINQTQTISSVDEAIQSLITKQDLYKTDNLALQVEVGALSSRFEGLSAMLGSNAVAFDQALGALQRYRYEVQMALGDTLNTQRALLGQKETALASQASQQNIQFNRTRPGSKKLQDIYVRVSRGQANVRELQDQIAVEKRQGTLSGDALNFYESAAVTKTQLRSTRSSLQVTNRNIENNRTLTDQRAQKDLKLADRLRGEVNQLSGLEGAQKVAQANRVKADADRRIGEIQASLNNPKNRLSDSDKEFYQNQMAQLRSLSNAATDSLRPSKAEEKAAKASERDAARARREAERDARRFNRGELRVSQTALKTAELDLDDAVKNIRGTDNFSVLSDGFKAVEEALAEWKEKRLDVMADEIKTGQLTGAQADNLNREVNNQIEAKFRDVRRAYGDALLKFLDNQIDAADRAFQRYVTPFEAQLNIASARSASLDREALRGRVPEFVRDEQQRAENLAQENLDRATIVANEEKLLSYTDALFDLNRAIELVQKTGSKEAAEFLKGDNFQNLSGEITVLASVINGTALATGKFSEEDLAKLRQALEEVEQKIVDTRNSNEALKASLQGEGLLPTSFTEGLRRAAANYATINGLNRSFEESLIGGLDTAISDVHGTWNQFMYDMLTKPNQVLANFQNFAMGIIRALQRMAAEALANQIFGTILKLVAGAVAPSVSNFDVALPGPSVTTPVAPLPGFFNGGIVGYSEGGMVNHGVPNRDSVLTALARGEYVVRKKAVDSVGRGFLDGINKNGAAALPSTQIALPPPAHQETNVYVVKDEPPPQMGPNDVLAVVANDVLKDGQMKRLIKHVAQGG